MSGRGTGPPDGSWEVVIGLEVHAQLATRSKAFCACPTGAAVPNTHVCPVCLGMPGALPVINGEMVRMAARLGLALGASVRETSRFARKSYFYPDLPKGYQITQWNEPLCEGGALDVPLPGGEARRVPIVRVHLEEDAGRSTHDAGRGETLVDYNRAGIPLVEIVGAPALRTPEEAAEYLKELRRLVMRLGICDGNMEAGNFRCDANISVRPRGERRLGVRTELKNLNSFRFLRHALAHEARRQTALLAGGGEVRQETRGWDPGRGETVALRSKEEAADYRYFPEPDLPPLVLPSGWRAAVSAAFPELPGALRSRLMTRYGLAWDDAYLFADRPTLAATYEIVVEESGAPKRAVGWVRQELVGALERHGLELADAPVSAATLGQLVGLVERGELRNHQAKEAFRRMWEDGLELRRAVAEQRRVGTDAETLRAQVEALLAQHPTEVARYRSGRRGVAGFFVGQIMKESRGAADPGEVARLVRSMLED